MITLIYVVAILFCLFKCQKISYPFTVVKHNGTFSLYKSLLSTELFCIGTPFQCLKAQFDPSTSLLIIQDKTFREEMNFVSEFDLYNRTESSTYASQRFLYEKYNNQKMIDGLL